MDFTFSSIITGKKGLTSGEVGETSGEVRGTSGEVWETSGEPLDCCKVPQWENFGEVAEKLPGKFGELPGKSGDFPEARGSLTPSQRLAKFVSKSFCSWEFISPKLPLPLPSWNSDEFPLPLPSWRPQSPLHFHWFPITVLKVVWIDFPTITVTVTVLKCFGIRKVIISNMTVKFWSFQGLIL